MPSIPKPRKDHIATEFKCLVGEAYGKSWHYNGSHTPALSQFVKPAWEVITAYFVRFGQKSFVFTSFPKAVLCHTPNQFESSITIPLTNLPFKILAKLANWHPSHWPHNRATEAKNSKNYQFLLVFSHYSCIYCHTPMKFKSLIPMSSLHYLLKLQPNFPTGSLVINHIVRKPK